MKKEDTMADTENLYDVIIVGGGPAGLSAAIYMARARYRVLVAEKEKIGGQITITSEIVNYPGIKKTSGKELTESMRQQAEAFGAEFTIAEVLAMELEGHIKILHTTKGSFQTLGVILAAGANPRKLGFLGEKEFQGRGVAYCATCDGEFFSGMHVFVIGGGFAAVEEGIFLTQYAKSVTLIVREEDFTCAKTVSDQLKRQERVSVVFNTEIIEVKGESMVSYARFRNNITGKEWTYEAEPHKGFGVFVFAGYVPNTAWMKEYIRLNEQGYIVTDENQKTNVEGVYGAGDLCEKNLRQVVTAVSDGAVAAVSLEKYLAMVHDKWNIPELAVKKADLSKLVRENNPDNGEANPGNDNRFLNQEIRRTLEDLFPKFQNKVIITARLDNSSLSGEIRGFLRELEGLSDKVQWKEIKVETSEGSLLPSMELCYEDGTSSGIEFHGVPGGHEFNSFVIALYNAAGPGQQAEPALKERLGQIKNKVNVKVMVSLSCTMCPEVVMAAQRAASLSPLVSAEMVDLMHYPELKEKYQIMSVPCMVVNDKEVFFGKKSLEEVVSIVCKAGK